MLPREEWILSSVVFGLLLSVTLEFFPQFQYNVDARTGNLETDI